VVHLLRNSFRYASRRDWAAIARDLKPVYTAPTEAAALDRFADFAATWEQRYPAIIRGVGERLGGVRTSHLRRSFSSLVMTGFIGTKLSIRRRGVPDDEGGNASRALPGRAIATEPRPTLG